LLKYILKMQREALAGLRDCNMIKKGTHQMMDGMFCWKLPHWLLQWPSKLGWILLEESGRMITLMNIIKLAEQFMRFKNLLTMFSWCQVLWHSPHHYLLSHSHLRVPFPLWNWGCHSLNDGNLRICNFCCYPSWICAFSLSFYYSFSAFYLQVFYPDA